FAQLRVALSHFFEQTHIFDSDDRLVGKGLQQRDLFVGKWLYLSAADSNDADRITFPYQRRSKHGPVTALRRVALGIIRRDFQEVVDVNGLPVKGGTTEYCISIERPFSPDGTSFRRSMRGGNPK